MRALLSVAAVVLLACIVVSANGSLEMAEEGHGLADATTRLRRKIKRAQRVLAEIQSHRSNAGAEQEAVTSASSLVTDAGTTATAIANSFVIGDVGSGGTRLVVYKVNGDNAVKLGSEPCAKESQTVPTNLDLIVAANDPDAKATQIVNHLLNMCITTITNDAASYASLGLADANDVKAWMAAVPMYYEATAGLRLVAQQLNANGGDIQTGLWNRFIAADSAWRQTARLALAASVPHQNLIAGGARGILLARVIPGALEGWYGFRAGLVAASNTDKNKKFGAVTVAADKLIYFEVGGASAQVVFTIPAPLNNAQAVVPGNTDVFVETAAAIDTDTEAGVDAEADAVQRLASMASLSSGMVMNAEMDMAITSAAGFMSATGGPVDLKLSSSQPVTPLVYSKSFLGNGMNRFTNAILHKVVASGKNTECSKRVQPGMACLDMPCWRSFAALTRGSGGAFAWDQNFCGSASTTCPDAKVLQDAYDKYIADWVAPQNEKSITRMIVGTDNFEQCLALARGVWSSVDEHVPAYSYYQQIKEVRAALKMAADAGNVKTHVMLSSQALEAGKDSSNDHAPVMSEGEFRLFLRDRFHLRLPGPFTYHGPMLGAYYTSLLFDGKGDAHAPEATAAVLDQTLAVTSGGGFDLHQYCPGGCKYGAWGISWTVGAADFFVKFGKEHAYRQNQYKAWTFAVDHARNVPAQNPDAEDKHFTVCADFLPNAGLNHQTLFRVHQAITQCSRGWQGGQRCKVQLAGVDVTAADNQTPCNAFSAGEPTNVANRCTCVPA